MKKMSGENKVSDTTFIKGKCIVNNKNEKI